MIGFFPNIYPDELLYSQLARYYVQSGYMIYRQVAEDLYVNPLVRPDINFLNHFTADVLKYIIKQKSMEQIVQEHTMFPYYGRFLPYERREKAYQTLIKMKGNYNNLLAMPTRKNEKHKCLRYCPICVKEDRDKYGETYWHRIHQMAGIDICPLHHCFLVDSKIKISGESSPSLVSAEEIIPLSENNLICENELQCELANYVMTIFCADINLENNILVGDFLHAHMYGTKYCSIRGEQRNIALFHTDFIEYYKTLSNNWFTELWQIQKVFTNDRINIVEICMIGMFLNIPTQKFFNMILPEKTQQELFDEEVYRLHKQGLKYPEIAKRMNASINTVKFIGEKRYGKYHKPSKTSMKSGAKPKDWTTMDIKYLPLVQNTIKQLHGELDMSRPRKITVHTVERLLGMPDKRISLYLPQCKKEILKHQETQEQYWAREIIWAVNIIIYTKQTLNWRHIRDLTNMRKCNFEACIPYLQNYTSNELIEKIKQILL